MNLDSRAALVLVTLLSACLAGDRTLGVASVEDQPPPRGVIVSDPVWRHGATAYQALRDEGSLVYVSLLPGTVTSAATASIRNLATGMERTAPLVDGGLDPVGMPANVGDTLLITVTNDSGRVVLETRSVVSNARPPVVVRTSPPPGKRDVPLNTSLIVVFSEPIDSTTLTDTTLHLLDGATPVTGQREFLDPEHLAAVFVPARSLAGGRVYTLVVTTGIRDLDGATLEAPTTVEFTTAPTVATQLTFATQPVNTRSGQLIPPVEVRAQDAFGNTDTSFVDSVRLSIAPNPATGALSGQTTVVARAGVAIFDDLRIDSIGVGYRLIATSGLLDADTSSGFDIIPLGNAVFSAPPTTMGSGLVITPHVQVTVLDSVGDTDTAFTGPVRLTIGVNLAGGTLFGATTQRAVAGVATFSNLRINVSGGGYTLVGTVPGRRSAESRPFNIVPMGPLSGRIAFGRCQDPHCLSPRYDRDLFVANADGTGEARLTSDTLAIETYPTWSPDGTRIAYTRVTETGSLFAIGADGSGITQLTIGQPQNQGDEDAAWSPDGTKLVFVSARDGGNGTLYVMNADGSAPTRLANQPPGDAYTPSWSPDGTHIVFASLDWSGGVARSSIYVLALDGTGGVPLTTRTDYPGLGLSTPVWSPDGSKIAFDGPLGMSVMNADGSGVTVLANGWGAPAWSPDGTRLAFARSVAGNFDIYVMNADGSGVTRVTSDPGSDSNPAWGPSGSLPARLRR